MKRRGSVPALLGLVLAAGLAASGPSPTQFRPEEIAQDAAWMDFLATAPIIDAERGKIRAVTNPWVLTLEKGGTTQKAIWKNPEGRMGGFLEGWKWEIAAYRLDRLLGLNMVPPTIERRFRENRGSLQLWVESKMPYRKMMEDKSLRLPGGLVSVKWNRAISLQRAFDNLIANEDRHGENILITEDWRLILIDHSRTFRTSPKFTQKLIYHEKRREGDWSVDSLPRDVWERFKTLDVALIKAAVGEYLTDEEIRACLVRRDLQVADLEAKIAAKGETQVLY
ncbi:MAG: hypothetical protein FJY82_09000 [Candidatus Aminicenantes bacterium]|nr:hypothetical protein [Candidatus Aminicenantes bacterium]